MSFRFSHSKGVKNLCLQAMFGLFAVFLPGGVFAQNPPESVVQTGHSSGVIAMDFSPDNRFLVSGGGEKDNSVKLWNIETGQEIRTFSGHRKSIDLVVFSRNGRFIASAGDDDQVLIWDVGSGKLLDGLEQKTASVWSMAFSYDDRFLALGKSDGTIELYDLSLGRVTFKFEKKNEIHSGNVTALNFNRAQPNLLVSGGGDGCVKIWDVSEKRFLKTIPPKPGDAQTVRAAAFSASGEQTIACYADGTVGFGSVKTPAPQKLLNLYEKNVSAASLSEDGTKVFFTGAQVLKIRDLKRPANGVLPESVRNATALSIALSPNGKTLAVGQYTGNAESIKLFDLSSGSEKSLKWQPNSISFVALANDNARLAVANNAGRVFVWDFFNAQPLHSFSNGGAAISALEFSPRGSFLGVGTESGNLLVWNTKTDDLAAVDGDSGLFSVNFSADETRIASGSQNGFVRFRDIAAKENQTVGKHNGYVYSVVFNPVDRDILVSGGADGKLIVWNLATKENTEYSTDSPIFSIDFSPDGKILVLGDAASNVGFFDFVGRTFLPEKLNAREAETKKRMRAEFPRFFNDYYKQAAVEKYRAEIGENGKVVLYDNKTGRELLSLGIFDESQYVVTTPDGFFDGTPETQKQVLWRLNGNTFDVVPVEAFYYEYFYPGLLKKIMSDEKPELPSVRKPFDSKDIRQAEIKILRGKCTPQTGFLRDPAAPVRLSEIELCLEITASPEFVDTDFIDARALTEQLLDSSNSASRFILSGFSIENKKKLANFRDAEPPVSERTPDADIKRLLRQELNRLVKDADFNKNAELRRAVTTTEIRELISSAAAIKETAEANILNEMINRKMLEEVYKNNIKPLSINGAQIQPRKQEVELKETENGGCRTDEICLRDLRLFWNGRLIRKWHGDLTQSCQPASFYRLNCETEVPLVVGRNVYSAYLFNQDRVKSLDAEIAISRSPSQK